VILSAGLTPAWQQILVFDEFRQGEVNRATETLWFASGKVLNAGIAAHHLGRPTLTLAPIGGPAIDPISAEFARLDIPHRWVRMVAATRVCTTLIDRGSATTTELVENGRPLSQDELDAYARAYEESVMGANMAIITGSLPSGTPHTFYRRLIEKTRCPCVLDFRGEGLLSVLEFEPLVIKPNRQELAATLGQPVESEPSLLAGMRSLNARGARWVLVTQGAGDVWLTSKSQTHRFHPPKIEKLVNPIASGDAMAAAIAWGVINGKSMPESVCIGIAAAGQNARDLLPCRLNPATLPAEAAKVVHTKI